MGDGTFEDSFFSRGSRGAFFSFTFTGRTVSISSGNSDDRFCGITAGGGVENVASGIGVSAIAGPLGVSVAGDGSSKLAGPLDSCR